MPAPVRSYNKLDPIKLFQTRERMGKRGMDNIVICLIFSRLGWVLSFDASESAAQASGELIACTMKFKQSCTSSSTRRVTAQFRALSECILFIAMFISFFFSLVLISFSNSSPALLTLDPDSASAKSLTWQSGFFFVTTWICFAVGEILLLAGVSVESGHLKNWSKPKPSCLSIREGLFCAAGVFALATVFLASALYLTALRALRISQEQENVRREVLMTSSLHASPPRTPQPHIRESPTTRETPLSVFPTPFNKSLTFV
ncbi:hypothetical protein JHK87_046121 [Glycine soja]|nr:hypothetical protein JHK87_046121 [Glycine soja]